MGLHYLISPTIIDFNLLDMSHFLVVKAFTTILLEFKYYVIKAYRIKVNDSNFLYSMLGNMPNIMLNLHK